MSVLNGLHGTTALLLLCSLIFVEETGVPLPILPGDLLLISAGVLIANGAMGLWVFLPAACLAATAGALVGYGWARGLGSRGLWALAKRARATKHLARASAHLTAAGPLKIALCRQIPGMRVYTTLVAGAFEVRLRRFVVGLLPAVVFWVVMYTGIGMLVGVPAERILSRAQQLLLDAALVVAIAVMAYLALRHMPSPSRRLDALATTVPRRGRRGLALSLDAGLVATIVVGLTEFIHDVIGDQDPKGFLESAGLAAAVILLYVVASRRGPGPTAGEGLLGVRYYSGRPRRRAA